MNSLRCLKVVSVFKMPWRDRKNLQCHPNLNSPYQINQLPAQFHIFIQFTYQLWQNSYWWFSIPKSKFSKLCMSIWPNAIQLLIKTICRIWTRSNLHWTAMLSTNSWLIDELSATLQHKWGNECHVIWNVMQRTSKMKFRPEVNNWFDLCSDETSEQNMWFESYKDALKVWVIE